MGLNQSALYIGPNDFETDIVSERQLMSMLANDYAGVWKKGDFVVAPGSGHTITVGVANRVSRCFLREKTNPVIRGSYFAYSDGQDTISLPVPQSQPFIATVILRVVDPQYGTATGLPGARIDIISNTPASSPSAISDAAIEAGYAQPGAWERLADIRINTADTGAVPAGQFTRRTRNVGRELPYPSIGIAQYGPGYDPSIHQLVIHSTSIVAAPSNTAGGFNSGGFSPIADLIGIVGIMHAGGDNSSNFGFLQMAGSATLLGQGNINGVAFQPGGAVVPNGSAFRFSLLLLGYILKTDLAAT